MLIQFKIMTLITVQITVLYQIKIRYSKVKAIARSYSYNLPPLETDKLYFISPRNTNAMISQYYKHVLVHCTITTLKYFYKRN